MSQLEHPNTSLLRALAGYKSIQNNRRHLGFEKQPRPTLRLTRPVAYPFWAVLLAAHAEARYLSSPPGRRLTLFGSHRLVMPPATSGDLAG